jgi:hypothetical protein
MSVTIQEAKEIIEHYPNTQLANSLAKNISLDLDSITTGEAKLTLDKVIKQIAQHENEELLVASDDIAIIAYALENNLQLRDYLMGLTSDGLSVESVTNILRVLVALLSLQNYPRTLSRPY